MASDLGLVRSSVADILGFQATSAEQQAAAQGTQLSQQGYNAEADAYGTATALGNQNAALAAMAGGITELQTQRKVTQAIGGQRADIAGAGFKESGGALDLLRSSYQQGYLGDQLIRTQTAMTQGGYLEEAAAATGEQKSAQYASQAAATLAAAQASAASTAKTNSANETAALLSYLRTTDPNMTTPENQLVTSTLSGDTQRQIGAVNPGSGGGSQVFNGTKWVAAGTVNPHTGRVY
jgi:hypothetical protein